MNTLNFAAGEGRVRLLSHYDGFTKVEGPFDAFRIILASRWFESFFPYLIWRGAAGVEYAPGRSALPAGQIPH